MVGEELDWGDEDGAVAGLAEVGEELREVGAEPLLSSVAGALVGELPTVVGDADGFGRPRRAVSRSWSM